MDALHWGQVLCRPHQKDWPSSASAVSTTSSSEKEGSDHDGWRGNMLDKEEMPPSPRQTEAHTCFRSFSGEDALLAEPEPPAAKAATSARKLGPDPHRRRLVAALTRIPPLHTFGLSLALVCLCPRYCPRLGAQLCTVLFVYGMLKFFLTGNWAVWGLWRLYKQERQLTGTAFDRRPGGAAWGAFERDVESGCREPHRASRLPLVQLDGDAEAVPDQTWHCVLIPCYKETLETVAATVETLAEQSIAERIVVVLAMEERDPTAEATAAAVRARFRSSRLAGVFHTMHRLRDGEVGGKSSNENWGFRCAKQYLCDVKGLAMDSLVFTTCDADTFFHGKHFEHLSRHFEGAGDWRHRTVWQGAICFLPNSHSLPALCSVRYTLLTLGYLGQLCNPVSPMGPFPLSVYSMSAKLAHDADYWDPEVVPEDWHMFFRANFEAPQAAAGPGGVRCEPLLLPIGCLGVEAETAWGSLLGCYSQAVRWQWGAIDLSYLVLQLFTSECSRWRKFMLFVGFWEHHLLYPVMWVAVMALATVYRHECLDLGVPSLQAWRGLSTGCPEGALDISALTFRCGLFFASSNWLLLIVLDWSYRSLVAGRASFDGVPQGFPPLSRLLSFILFPLSDVFLFVLPTFHAHAHMLLSTRFEYIVSPKFTARHQDEGLLAA
mmetsp:Transcript_112093/g.317102  ORF Transcript_112093/g.317102 Transcript_112093/m.317102 type:complete len:661 (-) Transcript_112093:233-2215(-)